MKDYLTLPLKKSVLTARVMAMTAKAAELVASADGEQAKRTGLVQKATASEEDRMLLLSSLRSAIDAFAVFIAGEAFGIQHIRDTLCDTKDDFLIEMDRPPRFNEAMRQPLVSQVSDFIVRSMLFQWYSAFSTEIAQQQASVLPQLQYNIARCFRKTDAAPLEGFFPTKVRINRASIPDHICDGDAFDLMYDISGLAPECINDVEIAQTLEGRSVAACELHDDHISVRILTSGVSEITLQSHHNTSVKDVVHLIAMPYV